MSVWRVFSNQIECYKNLLTNRVENGTINVTRNIHHSICSCDEANTFNGRRKSSENSLEDRTDSHGGENDARTGRGQVASCGELVDKLPFPEKFTSWWYTKSSAVILLTGCVLGKGLLGRLNKVKIHNQEKLDRFVYSRSSGTPLITVANHTCTVDDPSLIACMLKYRVAFQSRRMRWTLGAKELMFDKNKLLDWWFAHGKVIPTIRGHGVYQEAVNFAINRLNQGEWVHIFPEGKVAVESLDRLKWGVGRILAECIKTPIVVPFWHVGMDNFMQHPAQIPIIGKKVSYWPRVKQKITVLVGDPIEYEDILRQCCRDGRTPEYTRRVITDLIQSAFKDLKREAEDLHDLHLEKS